MRFLIKLCKLLIESNKPYIANKTTSSTKYLVGFLSKQAALSIGHVFIKKALTTTWMGSIFYTILEFTIFNQTLYGPFKSKLDNIINFIQKPALEANITGKELIIPEELRTQAAQIILEGSNQVVKEVINTTAASTAAVFTIATLESTKGVDMVLTSASTSVVIGVGSVLFLLGGPIIGSSYVVGVGTKYLLVKGLCFIGIKGTMASFLSTLGCLSASFFTHWGLKKAFKNDIEIIELKSNEKNEDII